VLAPFTVVNPEVDLSAPAETNSGRYWYNLHLVLVAPGRYRLCDPAALGRIRDAALGVCARRGHAASAVAVLPDHLHLALRADIGQAPEAIALSFLNNLAYALGQRPWWQGSYYAGTFGEYGMAAVRPKGPEAGSGP
jgi:REP element-mobilizing transposase RayT